MVDSEIISGTVVSAEGVSPGPASGITYTIRVNFPDSGTVDLPGQKPCIERWGDAVKVNAVNPGTRVQGWKEAGVFYFWNFRELPAGTDCAGNTIPTNPPPPGPPPPPPPDTIRSTGAPGQSQSIPPGGGIGIGG